MMAAKTSRCDSWATRVLVMRVHACVGEILMGFALSRPPRGPPPPALSLWEAATGWLLYPPSSLCVSEILFPSGNLHGAFAFNLPLC